MITKKALEELPSGELREIEVNLVDENGDGYISTFSGGMLGSVGEFDVYWRDDGRIVVHNYFEASYVTFSGLGDSEMEEYLNSITVHRQEEEERRELMNRLNITPK